MGELRGQLCVHCDRLGQPPLFAPLRDGSHAAPDVFHFLHSLFRVPAPAFDGMDGGEQAFASAGRILRGGVFLRQRDLYLADLGTDPTLGRCPSKSPPKHAVSCGRHSLSLRIRIDRRFEISIRGSGNLLLLFICLSKAGRARCELRIRR